MSQSMVDLVDFGILRERRLEIFRICMSQNVVDLGFYFDGGLHVFSYTCVKT